MIILKKPIFSLPENLFICYSKSDLQNGDIKPLFEKIAEEASLNSGSLQILKEKSGKPFGNINGKYYGVSISHTKDMLCCGLNLNGHIGLDIEAKDRVAAEGLRERVFHQREDFKDTDVTTIRLWTIKEAILKLTGSGLRTAMKNIEVQKIDTIHFHAQVESSEIFILSLELDKHWLSIAYNTH